MRRTQERVDGGFNVVQIRDGQTRNKRQSMGRFLAGAMTGGGILGTDKAGKLRPSAIMTAIEERKVREAAPEAAAVVVRFGARIRAAVTDTRVGRVMDGADAFQDAALAALEADRDGDDREQAATAATSRGRNREARRPAVEPIETAEEARARAEVYADRSGAAMALAVWGALDKLDRQKVRRALVGGPQTVGAVLGALASIGWDCRL